RRFEEVIEFTGFALASGTEGKRVVLWERALAIECRSDWRFQEFSDLLQRFPAFRVVNALPGVDDRLLGVEQHVGDLRNGLRIGSNASRGRGRVIDLADLLVEDIFRDFDESWTLTPVARRLERTPHRLTDRVGIGQLFGRLGDVLI